MQRVCEKKFMQRRATTFLSLALLIVPSTMGAKKLLAQTHAPQTKQPAQQSTAADAAKPRQLPPSPTWPADQPPNPAVIRWDSRGLEIEASNSSLDQILRQVAAATGAKPEGLTQDQRIFGTYGPGPGRDVLSKLLEGSGYNVVMYGGHDADVPFVIVLSARSPLGPQPAANHQNRSYSSIGKPLDPERRPDDSLGAQTSQANQDPFNIGGAPRDQAQYMQEILQRQQVIDQQQQQQDQKNQR